MTIQEIENIIKCGIKFQITSRPTYWSSRLSEIKGLDVVKYPYELIVKDFEIVKDELNYCIAIKCHNGYGWSIDEITYSNFIYINRKSKIEKLNL